MARRWFAALCFLVALGVPALADDYSLVISYSIATAPRPIDIKLSVDDSTARSIIGQPDRLPSDVQEQGKRKLAEREGYTEAIYGPDYWKMLQVNKWYYYLNDNRSNRAVASNRNPYE